MATKRQEERLRKLDIRLSEAYNTWLNNIHRDKDYKLFDRWQKLARKYEKLADEMF